MLNKVANAIPIICWELNGVRAVGFPGKYNICQQIVVVGDVARSGQMKPPALEEPHHRVTHEELVPDAELVDNLPQPPERQPLRRFEEALALEASLEPTLVVERHLQVIAVGSGVALHEEECCLKRVQSPVVVPLGTHQVRLVPSIRVWDALNGEGFVLKEGESGPVEGAEPGWG